MRPEPAGRKKRMKKREKVEKGEREVGNEQTRREIETRHEGQGIVPIDNAQTKQQRKRPDRKSKEQREFENAAFLVPQNAKMSADYTMQQVEEELEGDKITVVRCSSRASLRR